MSVNSGGFETNLVYSSGVGTGLYFHFDKNGSWYIQCVRTSSSGSRYLWECDLTINGVTQRLIPTGYIEIKQNDVIFRGTTPKVSNLSVSISAGIGSTAKNCSGSGDWELVSTPNITNLSITNRTATSLTFGYNVDYAEESWYRVNGGSWITASSNFTSGSITLKNLNFNNTYTIEFAARNWVNRDTNDYRQRETSVKGTTLDIARITKNVDSWSVEDSIELAINNSNNYSLQLAISYNNIEVISRNNLTLVNGKYTLTLTQAEKNLLYKQASSDKNPTFKFILKSYVSGSKIGEDIKSTSITFPTKAWVKVDGTWKRALVWNKINNTWKQGFPWIKVNNEWKRI